MKKYPKVKFDLGKGEDLHKIINLLKSHQKGWRSVSSQILFDSIQKILQSCTKKLASV